MVKKDKKKGFLPIKKRNVDDDESVDSRGNIRGLIDYGSSDDMIADDSSDSVSKNTRSGNSKLITKLQKEKERLKQQLNDKKKGKEEEDESMDNEEEEYDDDDSEYEDEEEHGPSNAFTFSFGSIDEAEKNVPKRHNMKKEADDVKEFVKLITTPSDEDTIDGQIDQFKALSQEKKLKLLNVLGHRQSSVNPQQGLMFKILTMDLPLEIQTMVMSKYNSLQNLDSGSSEYFKLRNWLEKLTSIPIGIYKDLPVSIDNGAELCRAFMQKARKCLDDAIYGQDEAKLQILQFIGTKIANPSGRGLSLLLSGPPGIGKTSLIKSGVAKALEWPFQFISLGGDSDASTYTGHQLVYESSHCGKIVNSLCSAKSMSMVLMFDELDKISTTPKGEEVQNLLVHLTDPVQNGEFEDKYLSGINIDLSRVMFTFSANDLNKIDRVLLDRMIVIQLQGYNQKEKVAIAENYLLPAALKDVGLTEKVAVSKEVLEYVLREYASEETGVRELKRCMEQISQKVNMLRMFNSKELPFYIKDFSLPFVVKKEHIDLFLKKKANVDVSSKMMYT
jgi:ATP-dependent Lon protease